MVVAVKRIRCTVDEREQKKLMMDLEVKIARERRDRIERFERRLDSLTTPPSVLVGRHEIKRLPLHRPILWSSLQRGRLLDLHGAHGRQFRTVLQVRLQEDEGKDWGGRDWEDCAGCMLTPY